MLRTGTFIFNQFLHVTFSHAFAVSFVQDTLILWLDFDSSVLCQITCNSFGRFEAMTYNKQVSIEDTSYSFLYDFMTPIMSVKKVILGRLQSHMN